MKPEIRLESVEAARQQLDPQLVRTVKKGLIRLITEYRAEINSLRLQRIFFYEDYQKPTEKFHQRQVNLFRQAGIDYWPFHCAILEHARIEREKTGTIDIFTKSGSILDWTSGNEQLSGYSGE